MEIEFFCPKCFEVLTAEKEQAGKTFDCPHCDYHLIIPKQSFDRAKTYEPEPEITDPIPGFWYAATAGCVKQLTNLKDNLTPLILVAAIIAPKFLFIHFDISLVFPKFVINIPIGSAIAIFSWAVLFWYYAQVINAVAFDVAELPNTWMGDIFAFFDTTIKSLFAFAGALLSVQVPTIIVFIIEKKTGVQLTFLKILFANLGLFFFPVAILSVAVGRDFMLLTTPYKYFTAIKKAFWPYTFTVLLLIVAWFCQFKTKNFHEVRSASSLIITLHFVANFAVQLLAISAMRSIGLFYKHFCCYMHF
jgi:DNA-directed RNA polymerase subunit RPC12/RpoP